MGQEGEPAIRAFLSKIESRRLKKRRQDIKGPKKREEEIMGKCPVSEKVKRTRQDRADSLLDVS